MILSVFMFFCVLVHVQILYARFKLHFILHLRDYFFAFALIPLATVEVFAFCRQTLLPSSTAECYV